MTIADWLQSNRHYHSGLLLLKKHSPNHGLLLLLSAGENSFTRAKLINALQEIAESGFKRNINITIDATFKPLRAEQKNAANPLQELIDKKSIAFKEMANLHAKLKDLPTDQDRYNAQVRILELDSQIDDIWHKIDYFNEHGQLPPDENELPINTIRDVVNAFKNIPTYISKINTKLKNEELSDEERDELSIKKNSFVSQLEKLEVLLNEPVSIQHISR